MRTLLQILDSPLLASELNYLLRSVGKEDVSLEELTFDIIGIFPLIEFDENPDNLTDEELAKRLKDYCGIKVELEKEEKDTIAKALRKDWNKNKDYWKTWHYS